MINNRDELYLDGWKMEVLHARCVSSDVASPDNGMADAGTIDSCRLNCEAIGNTCAYFGFRAAQASKCEYYNSNCGADDPIAGGSNVIIGSHLEDGIWGRSSGFEMREMFDFDNPDYGQLCDQTPRIAVNKGYQNRNTLEACMHECFNDHAGDCVAVHYRHDGTATQSRCFYSKSGCRKFTPVANVISNVNYDTYWVKGYYQTNAILASTPRSRMNDGYFNQWTVSQCPAKQITHSTDGNRRTYGQMRCPAVADGLLLDTGNVYDRNVDDLGTCAQKCMDWNNGENTTAFACRSFVSTLENDSSDNFTCKLYGCDVWTREENRYMEVYNAPTNDNTFDGWGFLDSAQNEACLGSNFQTEESLEVAANYQKTEGRTCTGSVITSFTHCSIYFANEFCNAREDCVGIAMDTNTRQCHIQKKCIPTATTNQHFFTYEKMKFYDDVLETIYPQSKCDVSNGAVLLGSYSDKLYQVAPCIQKCRGVVGCAFFQINEFQECEVFTDSCVPEPEGTTTSTIVYKLLPVGMTAPPTPQPTVAPSMVPQCTKSTDCFATNMDSVVCTSSRQCEIVTCNKHADCYEVMLSGRLPLCNLKTRQCDDTYASTCSSLRQCRSQARRTWRKSRALTKSSIRNRAAERKDAAIQAIQETREVLEITATDRTVYIGVLGQEQINVGADTIALLSENVTLLYESMVANFCGDAADQCEFVESTRRMLADENVTITITYDLDDALYQDLVASGYDFTNSSMFDAIALDLGLDPSQISMSSEGGDIEIEIIIVDDIADGDPIGGDALIDSINQIQSSLDNITGNVQSSVGAGEDDLSLNDVDYCGDRTCSGQGLCDAVTGYCDCHFGYEGINCEVKRRCDDENEGFCENGGTCADDGAQCFCNYPFLGVRCQSQINCNAACGGGSI